MPRIVADTNIYISAMNFAAQADAIVTGDRHLLQPRRFRGARITYSTRIPGGADPTIELVPQRPAFQPARSVALTGARR